MERLRELIYSRRAACVRNAVAGCHTVRTLRPAVGPAFGGALSLGVESTRVQITEAGYGGRWPKKKAPRERSQV
jgi:hypothetical protein